jgi:hypothetical protein
LTDIDRPGERGLRPAVGAAAICLLATVAATAQSPAPQNPSPMSDTTRPHPRVVQYGPAGRRESAGTGTLFVRDRLRAAERLPLVVHVHGAPWLVEHHVASERLDVLLVTVQAGSGSGVYGKAFGEPSAFTALVDGAAAAAEKLLERRVRLDPIVLTSFSAGYGAVRAILRVPNHYSQVSAVLLADSLHASYEGDAAASRSRDLDVRRDDLDVFLRLASDAAAGRKRFVVTHSEVYPGTYASTTETADALLRVVGLARRPRLAEGPIGMQQLSDSARGGLRILGYAGNSAPDHLDHLYAMGTWLRDLVRRQP